MPSLLLSYAQIARRWHACPTKVTREYPPQTAPCRLQPLNCSEMQLNAKHLHAKRTSWASTPAITPAVLSRPHAAAASPGLGQQHRGIQVQAVGDFFKGMFDFESWAPKSTRIWRLQQYTPPGSEDESPQSGAPDAMNILANRINELKDNPSSNSSSGSSSSSSGGGGAAVLDPEDQPSSSNSRSSGSSSSSSISGLSGSSILDDADGLGAVKSFSDAEDDELSAALSQRISQIATTTGEWGDSMEEEEMRQPLTGEEIQQLLLTKYGKRYDMSFVRRDVPGMKTFVCLNIMWLHLEQQSFKMTPEQYLEKLEGVAAMVNILGQTDKVRAFLKAPAKSQKGLPRRPVVGTAISIRFDLEQSVIDEWFGRGYD